MELLARLQDAPTTAHPSIFDDVHRRLQGALADAEADADPEAAAGAE